MWGLIFLSVWILVAMWIVVSNVGYIHIDFKDKGDNSGDLDIKPIKPRRPRKRLKG